MHTSPGAYRERGKRQGPPSGSLRKKQLFWLSKVMPKSRCRHEQGRLLLSFCGRMDDQYLAGTVLPQTPPRLLSGSFLKLPLSFSGTSLDCSGPGPACLPILQCAGAAGPRQVTAGIPLKLRPSGTSHVASPTNGGNDIIVVTAKTDGYPLRHPFKLDTYTIFRLCPSILFSSRDQ